MILYVTLRSHISNNLKVQEAKEGSILLVKTKHGLTAKNENEITSFITSDIEGQQNHLSTLEQWHG